MVGHEEAQDRRKGARRTKVQEAATDAKAEGAGIVEAREERLMVERIREQEMTNRLAELEKGEEFVVGGETSISDDVIAAIVGVAVKEVEGVASLGTPSIRRTLAERLGTAAARSRGVDVEAGKKEALVDISVNVLYGFNIPMLVIQLRRTVAARLLEMAGIVAKEINVRITGIEFPERMPGRLE